MDNETAERVRYPDIESRPASIVHTFGSVAPGQQGARQGKSEEPAPQDRIGQSHRNEIKVDVEAHRTEALRHPHSAAPLH